MKNKVVQESGKRKMAVARATVKAGKGAVNISNTMLDNLHPVLARLKIQELILLAPDVFKTVDINVNVFGGGVIGQAEAARVAIAKAIVSYTGDDKLKQRILDYDRNFLVSDVRRKEACKPNDSKARAKRQKSYR